MKKEVHPRKDGTYIRVTKFGAVRVEDWEICTIVMPDNFLVFEIKSGRVNRRDAIKASQFKRKIVRLDTHRPLIPGSALIQHPTNSICILKIPEYALSFWNDVILEY